jgi:hypothetical protein
VPTTGNPYAAPDQVPIGDYVAAVGRSGAPNYRYDDDPELVTDGFVDHPGGEWSALLDGGANGIPDAHRMHVMPLYDYRPTVTNPPQQWWNGPTGPGEEGLLRHRAVETVDGDGWRVFRGDMERKRAIPDIRRKPPPEVRKTSDMAPTLLTTTRARGIESRYSMVSISLWRTIGGTMRFTVWHRPVLAVIRSARTRNRGIPISWIADLRTPRHRLALCR